MGDDTWPSDGIRHGNAAKESQSTALMAQQFYVVLPGRGSAWDEWLTIILWCNQFESCQIVFTNHVQCHSEE